MKIPEILLIQTPHSPGALASVLNVIAEAGLLLEDLTSVWHGRDDTLWEITVDTGNAARAELVDRLNALPRARFITWADHTCDYRHGGNVEMRSRVAIVTDGSAVLRRGNFLARASLAAIEGKAALFAELVGISGIPMLIESGAVDHFVDVVCAIAPSFGAILLEDIGAPRCFEIEQKLRARLPMPVLHDNQHGTAVVVLAALLNASRQIGAPLNSLTVGVIGLGAAGLGIARLLHSHGVKRLLGTDLRAQAIGRLAQLHGHRESVKHILERADAVICATGAKGLIAPERVRPGQIIFALSDPDPEIEPAAALAAGAAVAADGKRINNVWCFPGLFDAALRAHARAFTDAMLVAAANALATAAPAGQLLPDPLDASVHAQVSQAVQAVAREELRDGKVRMR